VIVVEAIQSSQPGYNVTEEEFKKGMAETTTPPSPTDVRPRAPALAAVNVPPAPGRLGKARSAARQTNARSLPN